MTSEMVEIAVPKEFLHDIDAEVGLEGRSAYLADIVQAELRRRKLLNFLESDVPAWKEEDHPELADGSEVWVRFLRQQGEKRIPSRDSETPAA